MPTDRIRDWYDAVDCPVMIRETLDAAMHYHGVGLGNPSCEHDRLLAALVGALQGHYAPNDSKSLWKWLEEAEPALTARISSRNS